MLDDAAKQHGAHRFPFMLVACGVAKPDNRFRRFSEVGKSNIKPARSRDGVFLDDFGSYRVSQQARPSSASVVLLGLK